MVVNIFLSQASQDCFVFDLQQSAIWMFLECYIPLKMRMLITLQGMEYHPLYLLGLGNATDWAWLINSAQLQQHNWIYAIKYDITIGYTFKVLCWWFIWFFMQWFTTYTAKTRKILLLFVFSSLSLSLKYK